MANKEEVRSYEEFPDLVELGFAQMVHDYRQAHITETAAKATKERLKGEIEAYLVVAGQKRVKVGELIAVQCNGSNPATINKFKLLEKGVSADIIVECTDPGKKYTYIQVVSEKEGGNEGRHP